MSVLSGVVLMAAWPLVAIGSLTALLKLNGKKRSLGITSRPSLVARLLSLSPLLALAVAFLGFNVRGKELTDGFFAAWVAVIIINAVDDFVQVRAAEKSRQGISAA